MDDLIYLNKSIFGNTTTIKILGIKRFMIQYKDRKYKNISLENQFYTQVHRIPNVEFYGFI